MTATERCPEWGGPLMAGSHALLVSVAPLAAFNPFFLAVAAVSLMHLLCRLRLRIEKARGSP